jgi:hypothetical protein
MLRPVMEKVLRWFTRSLDSLYGHAVAEGRDDAYERIDSAQLGTYGFRASATMGLRNPVIDDFAETVPAFAPPRPLPRNPRPPVAHGRSSYA